MTKTMSRTTACVLTSALIIGGMMTTKASSQAAAKATLVTKNLSLKVGQSKTIKIKKVAGATYSFKSGNKKVATVTQKGKVNGKKTGSTKITVKQTKSGKTVKIGDVKVKVSAASASVKLTSKSLPVVGTSDDTHFTVYYKKGSDIPYIALNDVYSYYTFVERYSNPDFNIALNTNGSKLTLTRTDNGATSTIDFDKDTVSFPNFDKYFQHGNGSLMGMETIHSELTSIFKKIDSSSYDMNGQSVVHDLKKYNIDLIHNKDLYLMPLQTANDVFGAMHMSCILTNGSKLYPIMSSNISDEMYEDMKKTATLKFSDEYIQYDYNELCFVLDTYYGLKELKDIKSFDSFFTQTGLKSSLLSNDTTEYDKALYTALTLYIDDLHSCFLRLSYASDHNSFTNEWMNKNSGHSGKHIFDVMDRLKEARKKSATACKPYYESGDTAYITFNEFRINFNDTEETTKTIPQITDLENDIDKVDVIRLMQYAGSQILRKNSPIKKVVLDLTTNGGGYNFVGLYVLAAMLGEGPMIMKNILTGATTFTTYRVDNNLDHVFDKRDSFAENGLKLYCLTSGFSFSNGNFVPAALKNCKDITLIGQTSGGGTCVVLPLSSARGTTFNISAPHQFCYLINGTYYNIDRGVGPDIYVSDMAKLYNRNYVNSLLD